MPKDKLKDAAVRAAKPRKVPYVLTDGGGLDLLVAKAGSKTWRYRYRHDGKQTATVLGTYPDVPLAAAREKRDALAKRRREGRNPAEGAPKVSPSPGTTFEAVAREWHGIAKSAWSDTHASDVLNSLEVNIFPTLGATPIRDITPQKVKDELTKIEQRPAVETAHRVRQRVSQVFAYAIGTGRASHDPAGLLKPTMTPVKKGRMPAVTTLAEAREILQRVEAIPSYPITKLAMRLLALTVVRPGTLITTPWHEFGALSGDEPTWQIPSARMKLKKRHKGDAERDHLVPLAPQALEVIAVLRTLSAPDGFVFPNVRGFRRPMSENAIGYLLNRAGYHHRHVPHGWRATFSTVMNEKHPLYDKIIDLMLAHVPKDKVKAAYDRAAHLALRRELALEWATMLLEGMPPASALLSGPRH